MWLAPWIGSVTVRQHDAMISSSSTTSPLDHDVGGAVGVPVAVAHLLPAVGVVAGAGLEQGVDIVGLGEPLEKGDEVEELAVVHVVEPRGHGYLERDISGVKRVEANKIDT